MVSYQMHVYSLDEWCQLHMQFLAEMTSLYFLPLEISRYMQGHVITWYILILRNLVTDLYPYIHLFCICNCISTYQELWGAAYACQHIVILARNR